MPDKKTCTCMVLTRDAPKSLKKTLDSALASRCFEEIMVVVDSRSRISKMRWLYEYVAKYPQIRLIWYKWIGPGDFAAARNFAIGKMTTQYGFWLDSDEILAMPREFMSLLEKANGQAFCFWIVSPISGRRDFNMYQPRLFPLGKGLRFECAVLERIDWSMREKGVTIENTGYHMVHHTGYQDRATVKKKNMRNTTIARWALKSPFLRGERRKHLVKQYAKMRPGANNVDGIYNVITRRASWSL